MDYINAATGDVDYSSLSDEEWRKRLTVEQFDITRKKGTERAFTGYDFFWNFTTCTFGPVYSLFFHMCMSLGAQISN